MEKSKSALRISIMIMALMALFSLNAFADSSWVWISEKRPFDILPWVALGTILIEWLSIWLIPKTGHALKVLGIVMIANVASFLLPYAFLKADLSWYGTFECILRRPVATGAFASGHPALAVAGFNQSLSVQS